MKHKTNNGKHGGLLDGKPHTQGGIKAVVTDDNNRPVELESGEAIITKKAVKKHHRLLSKINESEGGAKITPPDSKELSKGIKEEKEHTQTAKKLFEHKITPAQAPKSIAEEHLSKDKKYYSRHSQIESHAHGGTIRVMTGDEVQVGDEVLFKNNRWVKITNITEKWVIFIDTFDNKRKDKPRVKFAEDVIEVKKTSSQTDDDVPDKPTNQKNISKFGPGDIVRPVVGAESVRFKIIDAEFIPEKKTWIYKVEAGEAVFADIPEKNLILVEKKNHLKTSVGVEKKNKPQPEFDPQKALDLWVKKNLKSQRNLSLKMLSSVYISEFAGVVESTGDSKNATEIMKLGKDLKNFIPQDGKDN